MNWVQWYLVGLVCCSTDLLDLKRMSFRAQRGISCAIDGLPPFCGITALWSEIARYLSKIRGRDPSLRSGWQIRIQESVRRTDLGLQAVMSCKRASPVKAGYIDGLTRIIVLTALAVISVTPDVFAEPIPSIASEAKAPPIVPGNMVSNTDVAIDCILDRFHDSTHRTIQETTEMFDGWFVREGSLPCLAMPIRLRVGLYGSLHLRPVDDAFWSMPTDFAADMSLPNMEERLRLFIATVDPRLFPGTDIERASNDLQLGLRKYWPHNVDTAVGIRSGWPPEPFVQAAWSKVYSTGVCSFYPRQTVYWDGGDGFGVISSLIADHWSGHWDLRSTSAARWNEARLRSDSVTANDGHGWQWEETIAIGYFLELLDEREYGRLAAGSDLTRGGGLRVSVLGGPTSVDIMRLNVFYKAPLHSRWLYYVITPEVEKSVDTRWNPEYRIVIGLEALFWGTKSR